MNGDYSKAPPADHVPHLLEPGSFIPVSASILYS